MSESTKPESVCNFVRKAQNDYVHGTTLISSHVPFSQYETIEKIEAYLNSRFTTGQFDSLGREKPFFNIVTAASNIWFRATDIDRKNIKIRATKPDDWFRSFLATQQLQLWMRKENFGSFLNEWGRTLARYGSATVKFIENKDGLHISVIPWNQLICDVVDFDSNPKIEKLELTESQLRRRVETHGYDADQIKALIDARNERENLDGQQKDNRSNYIQLFEVHGEFSKELITDNPNDREKFSQQIHVISFVGKKGKVDEYNDFSLVRAEEKEDPYMITHLIKEDGRTLAIGAVEHLFQAQWQINHSVKSVRDTLDIASKIMFQTADAKFLGRNVLDNIESGDIMIHAVNQPMTQVNTQATDLVSEQNYAVNWKTAGNEITGISEAMLGAAPKSGTAWRQTEAVLQESYSLFELMTENKGLYIEEMMRHRIIPYVKKQLNTSEEIGAILESHDIEMIDSVFIPNIARKRALKRETESVLNGEIPELKPIEEDEMEVKKEFAKFGNQRFFKPSDISSTTWAEYLKDLEWDLEVEITGEARSTMEMMTTLNTALQVIANPGYAQNKEAQMIVGRILEMSSAISPIELAAVRAQNPQVQPQAQVDGGAGKLPVATPVGELQESNV